MANYSSSKQLNELDSSSLVIDENSLIPCQSSPGQRLGSVTPPDIVGQSSIDDIQDGTSFKKVTASEKASYDSHVVDVGNPHTVTKTQVGLGNVDNTSDANKPISNATQSALDLKSDSTHLHTGTYEPANSNIQSHIGSSSNPHSVTKSQVGLGNVANLDTSNASNISSGTLDEARIDSDIARLTQVVEKTSATGSAKVPVGTELERDGVPAAGYLRFNSDADSFEGFNGLEWGSIGGGLSWNIYTSDQTTENGNGYMVDCSSAAKTITLHASPEVGDTVAIGDLKGYFGINNCTISRNSMLIQGVADDMLLNVKNQRVTLVYSGATDGWIITELEPNNSQFEYMPYAVMHVREEWPSGTNAGASIAGTQVRILNHLAKNEISGASLNANQLTLPAGEYEIKAIAPYGSNVGSTKLRLYNVTTSTYVLEGISDFTSTTLGVCYGIVTLKGYFTLTVPSVLELRHYTQAVMATTGLGLAISQGPEVYSEAIITKIGNNYAPRLITTNVQLQMVAGLDYTGNVLGFDVTKTGATQLTITPGTCKNHDGTVDLYTTVNTVINDAVVANTIYHFAVVRLNSGTITVRRYVSEAAMAADVGINITHFRWIGEWLSNGSSNYVVGIMVNGWMLRGKASESIISTGVTTSYATINHTTQMTPSRVELIAYGTSDVTAGENISASIDGTNFAYFVGVSGIVSDTDTSAWGTAGSSPASMWPFLSSMQFKSSSGTLNILVHCLKYRR